MKSIRKKIGISITCGVLFLFAGLALAENSPPDNQTLQTEILNNLKPSQQQETVSSISRDKQHDVESYDYAQYTPLFSEEVSAEHPHQLHSSNR